MIVSLVYRVVRELLAVPAVLLRRNMAEDAEFLVLRHENAVLRRRLTSPAQPLTLTAASTVARSPFSS